MSNSSQYVSPKFRSRFSNNNNNFIYIIYKISQNFAELDFYSGPA